MDYRVCVFGVRGCAAVRSSPLLTQHGDELPESFLRATVPEDVVAIPSSPSKRNARTEFVWVKLISGANLVACDKNGALLGLRAELWRLMGFSPHC